MAKPAPEYRKALDLHRQKVARLVENRSVNQLKKLYDAAQEELEAKLRRVPGRKDSFSAHQHRILLVQARQGQAVIAQRMAGELGDLSREAQVESLRGLSGWISRMEKVYTGAEVTLPIDEAATFWGVIDKRRTSLIRAHGTSMARYGASLATSIEEGLGLSLATGETTDAAIDRVVKVTGGKWYEAERIVRTETAFAYSATQADGIKASAEELPDLYMRWTEHVTDAGVAMDNRVGADSIAMHGQVARPDALFTMPDGPDVPDSLVGESWSHPPNRPNDRAVLSAWRPGWGGLAWEYRRGQKVFLSR